MDFSEHFHQLEQTVQQRYLEKISVIGADPYLINIETCSTDMEKFPKIEYPDIVIFLVDNKSSYTMEQLKSYKALEAYKYATCGWVKKVGVKTFGSYVLVLGKVMHSQRLNEPMLNPWIIAEKDGKVYAAHCNCIAGLGEACTHVGALLFTIELNMRNVEEVTVTGKKAYWMPPSGKPAQPKRVRDMDFTVPKKRCQLEQPLTRREKSKEPIPVLSTEEREEFLDSLVITSQGSALHLIRNPFALKIRQQRDKDKELWIMSIYNEEYKHKSLTELQEIGATVDYKLTYDDCKKIEKATKQQSKCKDWFNYRSGRITASRFKSCCRTKISSPSLSLIKSICYPMVYKFKSRALDYGCTHEKHAIQDFIKEFSKHHVNCHYEKMGLFINPRWPYFGASPDGVLECDCCGFSLIEIKCPYCAKDCGVIEKLDIKTFFLQLKGDQLQIKQDHAYYYQIQMQLALTEQQRCYLVAWSPKNFVYTVVNFNEEFWAKESEKAKQFFYKCILPEALGKYFTRNTFEEDLEPVVSDWDISMPEESQLYEEVVTTQQPLETVSKDSEEVVTTPQQLEVVSENATLYCICQKEDDHTTPMLACESGKCMIEWYHLPCVGLQTVPEEIWICNFCKK